MTGNTSPATCKTEVVKPVLSDLLQPDRNMVAQQGSRMKLGAGRVQGLKEHSPSQFLLLSYRANQRHIHL